MTSFGFTPSLFSPGYTKLGVPINRTPPITVGARFQIYSDSRLRSDKYTYTLSCIAECDTYSTNYISSVTSYAVTYDKTTFNPTNHGLIPTTSWKNVYMSTFDTSVSVQYLIVTVYITFTEWKRIGVKFDLSLTASGSSLVTNIALDDELGEDDDADDFSCLSDLFEEYTAESSPYQCIDTSPLSAEVSEVESDLDEC
uniref:ORF4 n=1 Tax=Renton virus TaxID=1888322 RepID=A0A1B2RVP7_9VIRU|nr:ORF4 [Renton virus]